MNQETCDYHWLLYDHYWKYFYHRKGKDLKTGPLWELHSPGMPEGERLKRPFFPKEVDSFSQAIDSAIEHSADFNSWSILQ